MTLTSDQSIVLTKKNDQVLLHLEGQTLKITKNELIEIVNWFRTLRRITAQQFSVGDEFNLEKIVLLSTNHRHRGAQSNNTEIVKFSYSHSCSQQTTGNSLLKLTSSVMNDEECKYISEDALSIFEIALEIEEHGA